LVVAATDVGISLIAAGSAVLGAAVGGSVSGAFSLRSERNRRDREDAQELKLAKGAAREMRATLRQSREELQTALDTHAWWLEDGAVRTSSLHIEERKVLASLMTKDQWDAIERADNGIATLVQVRAHALELVAHHNKETGETLRPLPFESLARAGEAREPKVKLTIEARFIEHIAAVDAAVAKLTEFDD
jgi:hypothetical protein